jgi:DNA-binding MarR family transcriptional regulator
VILVVRQIILKMIDRLWVSTASQICTVFGFQSHFASRGHPGGSEVMLSVRNSVKTKRLGIRLSIAVGARRRSHGGLTLIDASGLRVAAQHRQQYYEELNAVRAGGDYERWIDFFAEAIRHSAEVAIETGRRVTQAFREDRAQLRTVPRIAGSLLMIQEALQAKPVTTVAKLREVTGLTAPTINSLLRELESRGIIKESTGRARDRVYAYRRYLEALAAEEEAAS